MAIIPGGKQFRRRAQAQGAIRIPSDGAAKPYQALASLGGQMAQLAGRLYKDAKNVEKVDAVNEALTRYAKGYQELQENAFGRIQDNGMTPNRDGEMLPFSQVIDQENSQFLEDIEGDLDDPEIKAAFRARVAAHSRNNLVGAIQKEHKHKKDRYKINSQKAILDDSNTFSISSDPVLADAYSKYMSRTVEFSQRGAVGALNEAEVSELDSYAGNTLASTAARNIIQRGDVSEFNQLFGLSLLKSEEGKSLLDSDEYREVGVFFNDYWKEQKDAKTEVSEKYEGLRRHLSPMQQINFLEEMLRGLKQKNALTREGWNSDVRNVRAYVQDTKGYDPDKASKVRNIVKDIRTKGEQLDIPPETLVDTLAAISADGIIAANNTRLPWMDSTESDTHINNLGRLLELGMREEFKDDPVFQEKIERPGFISAITKKAKENSAVAKAHYNKELVSDPMGYIQKYSPNGEAAALWNAAAADVPDPTGTSRPLIEKAINYGLFHQKRLGLPEHMRQISPYNVSSAVGSTIDFEIAKDDGKAGVTSYLMQLKAQWGDRAPALLAEAKNRGHLTYKGIEQVIWMDDSRLMRDSLESIYNFDHNKKAYEDINLKKDKKIFNVDREFSTFFKENLTGFLQTHGDANVRRYNDLKHLVLAKFYALKRGKNPDSNDDDILKAAYNTTINKAYMSVDFGKSSMMIPKSYNLKDTQVKAGAKVLLNRAKDREVDLDRLPEIKKAYDARGYDDKRAQEAFKEEYGDRMKVVHPPTDGDGAVIRVYVDTPQAGGVMVPFRVDKNNDTQAEEIKLKEINSNEEVKAQEAEDAKSWFDKVFK